MIYTYRTFSDVINYYFGSWEFGLASIGFIHNCGNVLLTDCSNWDMSGLNYAASVGQRSTLVKASDLFAPIPR